MKTLSTKIGPTKEKPFFKLGEIEEICLQALKDTDLLPLDPSPIRIDRFIEKKFGVTYQPHDDQEGILGFTMFTPRGVGAIYVSRSLEEEDTVASRRRVRSTLAHEAGHGLLHTYLFASGVSPSHLFVGENHKEPKILCRDVNGEKSGGKKYEGKWWEFQANKAMAELLLPRALVRRSLSSLVPSAGLLGGEEKLKPEDREAAIRLVAETFDVNRIVAEYRIKEIFS